MLVRSGAGNCGTAVALGGSGVALGGTPVAVGGSVAVGWLGAVVGASRVGCTPRSGVAVAEGVNSESALPFRTKTAPPSSNSNATNPSTQVTQEAPPP